MRGLVENVIRGRGWQKMSEYRHMVGWSLKLLKKYIWYLNVPFYGWNLSSKISSCCCKVTKRCLKIASSTGEIFPAVKLMVGVSRRIPSYGGRESKIAQKTVIWYLNVPFYGWNLGSKISSCCCKVTKKCLNTIASSTGEIFPAVKLLILLYLYRGWIFAKRKAP